MLLFVDFGDILMMHGVCVFVVTLNYCLVFENIKSFSESFDFKFRWISERFATHHVFSFLP